MIKIKKFATATLAAAVAFSMAACGSVNTNTEGGSSDSSAGTASSSSSSAGESTATASTSGFSRTNADGTRRIVFGSWWVQHYDSNDTSLEDSPDYSASLDQEGQDETKLAENAINRKIAELKFDNVKTLEEKYNCTFEWQNLTYTGTQESINTSILAGTPDADIYLVDTGMAIPAQANGLAIDLKTVLPADADIFTDQNVIQYLDLGDGKACILKRTEAQSQVEATYPLAFNEQMLADANLEDPRDLWERGEWTWDKFIEYCQALTKDTDGDGQVDQYGYCGFATDTFGQLMMSNGATIAVGTQQTIDSAPVGEALQMLSDMFNVYNICYPYDYEGTPSDSMRRQYREGNIGFFPIAAWIEADGPDYDWDNSGTEDLKFDISYVRWPVGPSGNKDTNAGKNASAGEFYIIPSGIDNPELVYNFLYDYWNWMDGDYSLRDSRETLHWWYDVTGRDEEHRVANFNIMNECGAHSQLDLWESLGFYYDFDSVTKGEMTPAQFQETYKQQVQDGLDAYFGG